MMPFRLWPDRDVLVESVRIHGVITLIIQPAKTVPAPVGVLWIHGGGYFLGLKEMVYMGRAISLVKKYGVTVLSPGYRLAWQKPYPAAMDDCFAVLQYMDENKSGFGFERIMVGGESAGGGLCAAVCMKARDEGIHVAFQMPLYPMLSNFDTESSKDNHGKVWNTRRNHLGWYMYLRGDRNQPVSPYAAPAHQTDFSGLPPCYTFVGDGEPFYAETLQFVDNLKKAGIEAEANVYHTDVHAFDMLRPEDEISRRAIAAFEEKFRYAMENYS